MAPTYLTNYVGNEYSGMIEDNTTWYLGRLGQFTIHYRLAKYAYLTGNTLTSNKTDAKVGLLRFGELMSGQFNRTTNNVAYWLITPNDIIGNQRINIVKDDGSVDIYYCGENHGIKPVMNLKENVVITGGDGTKNNPFTIELNN